MSNSRNVVFLLALAAVILALFLVAERRAADRDPLSIGNGAESNRGRGHNQTDAVQEEIRTSARFPLDSEYSAVTSAVSEPDVDDSAELPVRALSENALALAPMIADLTSGDSAREHRAAYPLLGRSVATILDFQGRGGTATGDARFSMKPISPTEQVVAVNGKVYRFEDAEFPAWGLLVGYYGFNQPGSPPVNTANPLPDALRAEILNLAEYASAIARGQ